MGLSLWTFAVAGSDQLVRVPEPRYLEFRAGTGVLPTAFEGVVLVIEVGVELESRRPVAVGRCFFDRYRVTASGLRAPEDITSERTFGRGIIDGLAYDVMPPTDVLPFAPARARKRLAAERHWKPSRHVLEALCEYINARAQAVIAVPSGSGLVNV